MGSEAVILDYPDSRYSSFALTLARPTPRILQWESPANSEGNFTVYVQTLTRASPEPFKMLVLSPT